jgi:hypothetical protein
MKAPSPTGQAWSLGAERRTWRLIAIGPTSWADGQTRADYMGGPHRIFRVETMPGDLRYTHYLRHDAANNCYSVGDWVHSLRAGWVLRKDGEALVLTEHDIDAP